MITSTQLQHTEGSPMVDVIALAERIGSASANAIILGEDGVGHEALALHLHACSTILKSVVHLRCDGANGGELHRALFGQGEMSYRHGLFGAAHGGTLLLERVTALPLWVQAKLVNALTMTGSSDPLDRERPVRLIATTTDDVHALVNAQRFRRDLLDLLSCPITIPPLRERPRDVPAIVHACWSRIDGAGALTDAAVDTLEQQPWPGNARELDAFVVRLALATAGRIAVEACDVRRLLGVGAESADAPAAAQLPDALYGVPGLDAAVVLARVRAVGARAFLDDLESSLIDWALAETGGRRFKAARLLGMKRTTLVEKIRRGSPRATTEARASVVA